MLKLLAVYAVFSGVILLFGGVFPLFSVDKDSNTIISIITSDCDILVTPSKTLRVS